VNFKRMKLQSEPSMGKLTPELLLHLESRVGPIPEDYARFLLSCNGGLAVPELEFRSSSLPEGVTLTVYEFCSIHCSRGIETVDLDIERWDLDFGAKLVPVASDGIGNHFLMELSDDTRGKIHFRDHEEVDEDLPESGLMIVAKSFSEFVDGLHQTGPPS
jgi:hypothetical protein